MSPGVADGLSTQASSFLMPGFSLLYHSLLPGHYFKLGQVPNVSAMQPCRKCINRNFTARGCLGNSLILLFLFHIEENQCVCSPEHVENCPSKKKWRRHVKYNYFLANVDIQLTGSYLQLTIQLLTIQNYGDPSLICA